MSLLTKRIACLLLIVLATLLPLTAQAASGVIQSTSQTTISSYDREQPQDLTGSNLYAQSAILIDARSGEVLFSKNPDEKLMPASITKVLTALVVLEKATMQDVVTADMSKMNKPVALVATWLPLQNGEQLTVQDLLYCMMLKSHNDAAAALAVHVGGSMQGFADMMNQKAQELGCANSNFVVPHGITAADHYTTAGDMAKIAAAAMQNATFREIVKAPSYTLPPTNKVNETRKIVNGNKMLPTSGTEYSYDGCIGMKTGYTNAALHTFIGAAQRDGVNLICVVLGTKGTAANPGDGKWLDAQKLFDYGFAVYQKLDVAALYAANPTNTKVAGSIDGDLGQVMLEIADPAALQGIIVKKQDVQSVTQAFSQSVSVSYHGELTAPITKGQSVATMSYTYGDLSATFDLVASRDVIAASTLATMSPNTANVAGSPPTLTEIAGSIETSPVRYVVWLLLIPVVLLIALVFSMLLEMSRRRKRIRSRSGRAGGGSYYGRSSR